MMDKHEQHILFFHFFVISAISPMSVKWPSQCPDHCQCVISQSTLLNVPLRTVNCSSLGLTNVPKDIPQDSESLIFTENYLTDLFDQFPPLLSLQELDLSHNQIKQLGRGIVFYNFTELRYLDLSYNDFRILFNGVFKGIHQLQILIITNVQIKFIDQHVFDGLHNLKRLQLDHNQLNAIYPEWFHDLGGLETLYLDFNSISHINSGSFASLKNLQILSITNNKIRGINDFAFTGMENLTHLYLENNQLQRVPSTSLQSVAGLQILKLGGNAFSQLMTGDFGNAAYQEVSLQNVPDLVLIDQGAFKNLTQLHKIHLDNNRQLQYIDPHAFTEVPNVQLLLLHNNNLSALSKQVVDTFKFPMSLSLYNNPLLCDCNIKWLHEIIGDKNHSKIKLINKERMKCDRPLDVREWLVENLNPEKMQKYCPPDIVGKINNTIYKKVGDKHVFQCRAHGIPLPKVYWILPNGAIVNDTADNTHLQLNPNSLEILNLKPNDTGTYMCVAENDMGETTSITELTVENIDIHIFPLGVASTFVTVVWNGTARNTFPEYEILYQQEGLNNYESVTVNQFFRYYTINNLLPHTTYKFCIGVKSKDDDQYMQFSCTRVKTRDESFMLQGIHHTSNIAVAVVLGIVATMMLVVCMVTVAARKYRQRHYDTPEKSLVSNMAQIPMENLHSPLMSHAGS